MGIFTRLKKGIRSKANSAVDRMVDPEKELDIAIMELEEQRKKALQELLSYKTTAKQMEQDIERYQSKAKTWEQRAMEAVKRGDDEMARKALSEKKLCLTEAANIKRDRDEAASYAIELNNSRKKAETKLKILKLKKGTMAQQLAVSRAGGNAFGHDDEVWDRFQRAEDRIDEDAIKAEVDAALEGEEAGGEPLSGPASEAMRAGADGSDPDWALAELKAKMAEDEEKKKLPE